MGAKAHQCTHTNKDPTNPLKGRFSAMTWLLYNLFLRGLACGAAFKA